MFHNDNPWSLFFYSTIILCFCSIFNIFAKNFEKFLSLLQMACNLLFTWRLRARRSSWNIFVIADPAAKYIITHCNSSNDVRITSDKYMATDCRTPARTRKRKTRCA